MTQAKRWNIDIYIGEEGRETYAEVRLHSGVKQELKGVGRARRNPTDPDVPEIGDELAVSRALSDLAHKLLNAAIEDIEGVTEQRAYLSH
jgi:hypothetical protein